MKENVKFIFGILIYLVLLCSFTYCLAFIFKHFSYWLFYEDMVRQTIVEMVDNKYLLK